MTWEKPRAVRQPERKVRLWGAPATGAQGVSNPSEAFRMQAEASGPRTQNPSHMDSD